MPRIAVIEDTLEFLAPVRDVFRRMVRDIRTANNDPVGRITIQRGFCARSRIMIQRE
jgi:hypothetical protein